MAYVFGDGFDLYAAVADAVNGYWDSGNAAGSLILTTGRFAGGQAVITNSGGSAGIWFVKSSGANDAVHHIICAFNQFVSLSGVALGQYFQLSDGLTNQVCIVFRSDGAILLTSATPAGTVLDTYTGAVSATNTWFAFEFEVVINNTTGSWAVRKNGNTSNDHALGSLNTRPGANPYANKLTIGAQSATTPFNVILPYKLDDVLWRSDAASVPWVGDVRCYTRMPASDVSVQFARLGGATNTSQVSEAHQDGATTYVYDSTPGDADFYGIAAIASTPVATIAVTTRGFMEKSDAGARTGTVQLKSGATTVAAPTATLGTSFGWVWRTDVTDPATSAAWTASGVNAVTIGPQTVA